uniref:Bro-N domain-containing protein n=1 Tax=uncultured bacterium A1Q1_fos_2101 TaxID=1256561 RepID=L7VZ37_9BACT|nr:hypothetical protein [uncultured bacterium A1Q1_fos_2101]
MSAPAIFENGGWNIRVLEVDGEPWFVAVDVCKSLGIANTTVAVSSVADDALCSAEVINSLGRTLSPEQLALSG